jgi:hypothetical protein
MYDMLLVHEVPLPSPRYKSIRPMSKVCPSSNVNILTQRKLALVQVDWY